MPATVRLIASDGTVIVIEGLELEMPSQPVTIKPMAFTSAEIAEIDAEHEWL